MSSFDKSAMKQEYRDFSIDDEVTTLTGLHGDAVQFWLHVMTSPMRSLKYHRLATLALHLLAIAASNADSEHAFSLV